MNPKRTYFGLSTAQQRKLMFVTWEASGSVTEACRTARLCRGSFYYWKARFDEKGYAGLEEFDSRVPHKLRSKGAEIEEQVIQMRSAHPDWGKARIAHEMAKGNNWVPLVSPNTVKRILNSAGMWSQPEPRKKGG